MTGYNLQELYHEYIYQRENGIPREEVIQLTRQLAADFDEQAVRQLIHLIQMWEQRHHPAAVQNSGSASATVLICPNCQKNNPIESKYCYACGHLLGLSSTGKTTQLDQEIEDGSIFGRLSTLNLTVRGYEREPVRVQVGEAALIVGRNVPESRRADIDLQPLRGQELGVSRVHASLHRENQTLILMDQGSANHTYINGELVHPHEKRVVRDGDELRFGRLTMRVTFQRELRRL